MRVGIRTSAYTSASTDARAKIVSVTSTWFRDFWFTASYAAGVYALNMYDTKADAVAGTNRLAHATGITAGLSKSVGMTLDGIWYTGSTTVVADFIGTWSGTVVLGYVANATTELVDQIVEVLNRYTDAHESLAALGLGPANILKGLQEPNGTALCVVARGQTPAALAGGPFDSVEYDIDLVAFELGSDVAKAQTRITNIADTLRSIVEEQRFWGWGDPNGQGGPIVGTVLRGSIESGPVQSDGAFYHRASLPLRIELQLFTDAVAPTGTSGGGGAGGGGKYGDPSIP